LYGDQQNLPDRPAPEKQVKPPEHWASDVHFLRQCPYVTFVSQPAPWGQSVSFVQGTVQNVMGVVAVSRAPLQSPGGGQLVGSHLGPSPTPIGVP
jgi:hypothetical protein